VDSASWAERTFWTLACCVAAIVAIFLTATVSINYIGGASYETSYSVEADEDAGLVQFPDILFCTSAPWDLKRVKKHGIRPELLSYISNFLFPIAGFGMNESHVATDMFLGLEREYQQMLTKFDNNALYLLHNITKTCHQILNFCVFGTVFTSYGCCAFFNSAEFILGRMCFRTNRNLYFAVQEAGMINSMVLQLNINGSGLDGLDMSLINPAVPLFSDQVALALTDNRSHTALSQSRQESTFCYSMDLCLDFRPGLLQYQVLPTCTMSVL
jgi:hypothetical protein